MSNLSSMAAAGWWTKQAPIACDGHFFRYTFITHCRLRLKTPWSWHWQPGQPHIKCTYILQHQLCQH
jgi:hypothetical protein